MPPNIRMRALPVLQTQRLRLRWFTPRDAGFVCRLLNDPGWIRQIGDRGVRTRAQAAAWISRRLVEPYGRLGFGFWAMERIDDGTLVGLCGLIKRDTLPQVDVGYALMPMHRGRGYAREAAGACLDYARDVLGLPEVWGITSATNADSARVLGDIGLHDAGVRQLAPGEELSRLFRSVPFERGDDLRQLDALVTRYLAATSLREGRLPGLPALPHYFTPEAMVRIEAPAGIVDAITLHAHIAGLAATIYGGRLQAVSETPIDVRTELAGAIAQRWVRSVRKGLADGRSFESGRVQALQCVRTVLGWKITALAIVEEGARNRSGIMAP